MANVAADPVQVAIDRAIRRERRVAKGKRAIIVKAEPLPAQPPPAKLAGTPDEIGMIRAQALRIPPGDLTSNVIVDLYHDAVARDLVDGVRPTKVTQAETDAYLDERVALGVQVRQAANLRKWAKSVSFWKTIGMAEGGDCEDYSDLFAPKKEDID